jgi:Protein of unknown function (DUF4242)
MTRYVLEVYAPESSSLADVEAHAALVCGDGVCYVRSLLLPEDETCFHVFEAPSAAAIVEASRRASVPFLRVTEAIG